MRPARWRTVCIALVAVVAIAIPWTQRHLHHSLQRNPQAEVALPLAPNFSLTDLNGNLLQLSDYRGKVVLLDFWATWCAPCKVEIPHFVELQKKYGEKNLQVIGVSMDDDSEPVKPLVKELSINYPIVMGDVRVAESYGGILGLPVLFFIDRKGGIQRKIVGEVSASEIQTELQKMLQNP